MDIEIFINELIKRLSLQNTEGVKQFFRDWIKAERRAAGRPHGFNPLNTTFNLKSDKGMTNFNKNAGYPVKNYSTFENGLTATVKTLQLSYYKNLVNYLKGIKVENAAEKIARELRTWGTVNFANKFAPKSPTAKPTMFLPILLVLILIVGGYFLYTNINPQFIV
jgi:hypothetical protein